MQLPFFQKVLLAEIFLTLLVGFGVAAIDSKTRNGYGLTALSVIVGIIFYADRLPSTDPSWLAEHSLVGVSLVFSLSLNLQLLLTCAIAAGRVAQASRQRRWLWAVLISMLPMAALLLLGHDPLSANTYLQGSTLYSLALMCSPLLAFVYGVTRMRAARRQGGVLP